MARFQMQDHTNDGKVNYTGVSCAACGKTDMFQHNLKLLTCNGCGYTFVTPLVATVIVEQVVLKYHDSR